MTATAAEIVAVPIHCMAPLLNTVGSHLVRSAGVHNDRVCWWCGVLLNWMNLSVDPSIDRLLAKDLDRVQCRTCAHCRLRAWSMMEDSDEVAGV